MGLSSVVERIAGGIWGVRSCRGSLSEGREEQRERPGVGWGSGGLEREQVAAELGEEELVNWSGLRV